MSFLCQSVQFSLSLILHESHRKVLYSVSFTPWFFMMFLLLIYTSLLGSIIKLIFIRINVFILVMTAIKVHRYQS